VSPREELIGKALIVFVMLLVLLLWAGMI